MDVTDKFDKSLKCNLEPFGYIEDKRVIDCRRAGQMIVVSYGALNKMGHYAPELGGVAIVHIDPDLFIAAKYIPWNREERAKELERQVKYFNDNQSHLLPDDIVNRFTELEYAMPAQRKRAKEAYIDNIAAQNIKRAKEMAKEDEAREKIQESAEKNGMYSDDGEKLIPLDEEEGIF
jgi:hypothetical protein